MILAFWYLRNIKYDVDLSEKLQNILKWADHNKMQVNMAKQKK